MTCLDYRPPPGTSFASLGNVAATGFAAEWVCQRYPETCTIPSPFYKELWPLFVPRQQIVDAAPDAERVPCKWHEAFAKGLSWIETALYEAGHELHGESLTPRTVWLHDRLASTVFVYPREHECDNRFFTGDYWVRVINLLKKRYFRVVAILQDTDNPRDGRRSRDWCTTLLRDVRIDVILPSTMGAIQAGIGLSSVALGRCTGPGWLTFKSSIPFVALDDPADGPTHKAAYHQARGVFPKSFAVVASNEPMAAVEAVCECF